MKKNSGWARPDDFSVVFRCTTQKYAENFLKKGEIKFGTPQSWVEYAFEKGDGRGDKLEGTLATYDLWDIEKSIKLNQKYKKFPDLTRMTIGRRVYLKKGNDMMLPCFCFYILKQSMFECPQEKGEHKLTTTVPASYFRDFVDNMTPQEIAKLSTEDKPAVIFIYDYKEFEKRLITALLAIGVKKEDIISSSVLYLNFNKHGRNGWWDFGQKSPFQLTIKHSQFENQSEARIIVNTNDEKIKQTLSKPIEICLVQNKKGATCKLKFLQ